MNFDTAWKKLEERAIWDFADKKKTATIWIELDNGSSCSLTAKNFFKNINGHKESARRAFEKYHAQGRYEIINGITNIDIIIEGAERDGKKETRRITA